MRRIVLVCVFALVAPVAMAQDSLTKRETIEESAAICRALLEDTAQHVRGMNRADGPNELVRHGRRFVRDSRPHVRELRDLPEPEGAVKYRRYVNNISEALDWLEKAFNALEARRGSLARRRANRASEHATRAKRAGKAYGLRRPCIQYAS